MRFVNTGAREHHGGVRARMDSRAALRKESSAHGRCCTPFFRTLALLLILIPPTLPLSSAPARAQSTRAYLSVDSVKVGERFRLSVVADHNFMTKARFPAARADSGAVGAGKFGDLVVLALRDSIQRYLGQNGMRRDSVVYEVATFALDTARVGPIPVAFVQNGDTARTIATRERLLRVESVLPSGVRAGRDTAQLKPLTPPASFPRPLWPWLLGGTGAVALAALLAYLWYARDGEEAPEPAPQQPPVPPAEAARRRLRRLEETTDLSAPDTAKPFYDDLSAALRRYLMHRLGLRAFRSTTGELVNRLRHRTAEGALPETVPTRARRVLEGADLAKFADQRPAAEAREGALADARAVIDTVEEALQPTADENRDDENREATPAEESP